MIKVTKKEYGIPGKIEKAIELSLIAIGEHLRDALADGTHKLSGLLANSYNYKTIKDTGAFGTDPMKEPKQTLTEEERVTRPTVKFKVRTGSALSYVQPYNKRFKVFEKTMDNEQRNLGMIVKASLQKVVK